jgi:predicted transcriptional regulator
MGDATFTFRVEETLKEQFAMAAKGRDRSGAQLLRDFMREFVQQQLMVADHEQWFRQQVQAGVDSANAGNLIPAADVEAKFATRRAITRRKLESVK